jgi:hypothetical protein
MPPKHQQESTKLENYMLYIAAKLLEAVRWVAEHRPSPEKSGLLKQKGFRGDSEQHYNQNIASIIW